MSDRKIKWAEDPENPYKWTDTLTCEDFEKFKWFNLSDETVIRLRNYLKEWNLKVRVDCYTGNGQYSARFVLEGVDLSVNGCHFGEETLLWFLDKGDERRERPLGFYWCKFTNQYWLVGYWNGKRWHFIDETYFHGNLEEEIIPIPVPNGIKQGDVVPFLAQRLHRSFNDNPVWLVDLQRDLDFPKPNIQ